MSLVDREVIFYRARQVLQMLTCPAEIQIQLYQDVCVDELAEDFDHWRRVLVDNFGSELTPDQIESLTSIDYRFTSLGRGGSEFTEEFWTDDGLRLSSDWEDIRGMARQALQLFGWPVETPTNYNLEYVTGRRDERDPG